MLLFPLSGTAATKGIRIVPRSAWVKNDSLHLSILMDLEDVQVNTYTAVTFTPVLKNKQSTLELPAVILTGGSRHRFDRREQALQTNKSRQAVPFLTIIENRHTAGSKKVDYLVTVPYAAWMQQSSLLLRQDLKDCCDTQTLGIDTLRYRLPFASALHTETATVTKEQNENKAITKRVLPHTVRPAKNR